MRVGFPHTVEEVEDSSPLPDAVSSNRCQSIGQALIQNSPPYLPGQVWFRGWFWSLCPRIPRTRLQKVSCHGAEEARFGTTVAELAPAYLDDAEQYYVKDGQGAEPVNEIDRMATLAARQRILVCTTVGTPRVNGGPLKMKHEPQTSLEKINQLGKKVEGMTQAELARAVGCSRERIRQLLPRMKVKPGRLGR
jgi:hypothetical protein